MFLSTVRGLSLKYVTLDWPESLKNLHQLKIKKVVRKKNQKRNKMWNLQALISTPISKNHRNKKFKNLLHLRRKRKRVKLRRRV
jgi:hypothetical protein